MQKFMTSYVFWIKKSKKTTSKEKANKTSLPEPGLEPGTSRTPVRCVTSTCVCTEPRQQNASTEDKLCNCLIIMGRNVNNSNQNCGRHFFNYVDFFCNIFCMNNYICQFLIFTEVGFTA